MMKKSAFVLLALLTLGFFSFVSAENLGENLQSPLSTAEFKESAKLNLAQNSGAKFGATQKAELSAKSAQSSENSNLNAPQKPIISVSIPPQAYFVRKIADDTLQINVIIPNGADEHNFDFKPTTIKALEKSDIYFGVGLELEKNLLARFQSVAKNLRVIDTGARLRHLANLHDENSHHAEHSGSQRKNSHAQHSENSSAPRDKHAHNANSQENKDPHIWLDPILVKKQADIMANALITAYPQHKRFYEANLAKFQAELDALHAQILALLAGKKGKKFIVYHPSWGYFAARYDLVQIPVEFEGKEPKARHLKALINTAKKEQIHTIFVQQGFPQSVAKSLAKELNADIVEINHLSDEWQNELLKTAGILGR